MMLRPNGRGSYVMQVAFRNGKQTEITVDSGAEENVCPWAWGEEFGIAEAPRRLHWGQRDVVVNSLF